jgi:hypothetical protein
VEVFPEGQADPVLSWRPARPVQEIPVWAAGRYHVSAGKMKFSVQAVRA